jgi:coenzyme F420-reducing hydrogenase alpha subunit
VHPVNLKVGGFNRALRSEELEPVAESLRVARDDLFDAVAWAGELEFPEREIETELVALGADGEYPIERGTLHSSIGEPIGPEHFERDYLESQVPHSTALHSHHRERGAYVVGPIARYGLFSDLLPVPVREAARSAGLGAVCRNPFKSIVVRCVEMLFAADEALRLIESYEPPPPTPDLELGPAAVGSGWSEAPRGMLWHRYSLAEGGRIREARIVAPTSQNQAAIEADLRELVQANLDLPDADLQWRCEQAVRNYDPCISCSTHFLRLSIDRG